MRIELDEPVPEAIYAWDLEYMPLEYYREREKDLQVEIAHVQRMIERLGG